MWHKMYNQYDFLNLLSANPQNGLKHIRTIRWQTADELLECV